MATLDTTDVSRVAADQYLPGAVVRDIAARVFWDVYRQHRNDSWKGRVGPIPYSVKLAKLLPLFEHWFGPAPADLYTD